MTDAEFEAAVRKISMGDKSGLRDIYDAYADIVYRIFLGKVHHHQDAEDLTSDFFLKLWNIAGRFYPGHGHRSWLTTIAWNMATDHLRRAGRELPSETPAQEMADAQRTEDTVTGKMHTEDILSVLPEEEQEIVRLHLAAELTFREVAEVLRRPLGTVSWKYRNAMQRLKKLAEEGSLL